MDPTDASFQCSESDCAGLAWFPRSDAFHSISTIAEIPIVPSAALSLLSLSEVEVDNFAASEGELAKSLLLKSLGLPNFMRDARNLCKRLKKAVTNFESKIK